MKRLVVIALSFSLMLFSLGAKEPVVPTSPEVRLDALNAEQVKEALSILQQRHVSAKSLDANALARATLRGLLANLQPGAELSDNQTLPAEPSPFRAEVLPDNVGYIRLGSLEPATVTEMAGTLKDFVARKVDAVVLDLRSTAASEDFGLAAAVAGNFVPKGTPLFSLINAEGQVVKSFTSETPQAFSGVVVLIADASAAGASEAIAATLRKHIHALLVGTTTSGRAVEFSTVPLGKNQNLHLATAEVKVEGLPAIFPQGLRPDLEVAQPPSTRTNVLAESLETGAAPFVFERERTRMNEAALMDGTNPEIEEPEEREAVIDRPLQRAVDLVIAIRFFRQKDASTAP